MSGMTIRKNCHTATSPPFSEQPACRRLSCQTPPAKTGNLTTARISNTIIYKTTTRKSIL